MENRKRSQESWESLIGQEYSYSLIYKTLKHTHRDQQLGDRDGWQHKTATIILTSSVEASKMEDPNLIATLIPVDEGKRAENAFCRDENKNRFLPPTQRITEGPTISSREATPAQEQPIDDHCKYDSTHRLQLTFDKPPKDRKTYKFGTDPNSCDVLLGSRGARGISGVHFCITFIDTIDDEMHLILRDSSTNRTAVSYNGQATGKCGITSPGFWT